jgi:hypothetical protein
MVEECGACVWGYREITMVALDKDFTRVSDFSRTPQASDVKLTHSLGALSVSLWA